MVGKARDLERLRENKGKCKGGKASMHASHMNAEIQFLEVCQKTERPLTEKGE
jgi:hypothetical protein